MILRGFAGRWTKRRRRKRGPWRQSKGASFEKARGHRTEPYVAITREKECAESGKVNGDTRKRIRGRRKRRRRRKRIERQRSNQKGMNIHERAPRLTVIESEKCYREGGIERSHFKIKCINLPRCARVLKAGSRGERSGCPVSPNNFSIIDNVEKSEIPLLLLLKIGTDSWKYVSTRSFHENENSFSEEPLSIPINFTVQPCTATRSNSIK